VNTRGDQVTRYWAEEIETLPTSALSARQLGLAGEQVSRAAAASPFYGNRLGAPPPGGFGFRSVDDFAQAVAATTKEQIIAAQQTAPPFGGLLAVPEDDVVRYYIYPAGQVLGWNASDHLALEDMYAGGLYTAGFRRTDRVDITFQYHWEVAGTIWDAAVRHLGAAAVPGGAGESARHASNMALLGVNALIGFSTFLERIAESAAEQDLAPEKLGVEKMIIVGEWHGSDAKGRIADIYGGASVREAYGTGETGLVAAECGADPDGMHVHHDVLLEVRHETTGEPVAEGEGGEVYLTPLTNQTMPVLRFRTGDITESVRFERCECGRTTPRIGRIIGRSGQLLRVKGIFLSRPLVASVVTHCLGSEAAFQMTVDRPSGLDRLRLQVEADGQSQAGSLGRLVQRMKARAGVAVEVEAVAVGSFGVSAPWFVDERR
jgi:phenylacetate-CoA ligase